MTPAEAIGRNVERARKRFGQRGGAKMTQEDLGQRLGSYLGKPWPKQAVSAAEQGRRRFDASELLALASALGVSVSWLLVPEAPKDRVTLPSGRQLSGYQIDQLILGRHSGEFAPLLVKLGGDIEMLLMERVGPLFDEVLERARAVRSVGRDGELGQTVTKPEEE